MSGHHITVMCSPLMKCSQSIVFEWFSEAVSSSTLVQCNQEHFTCLGAQQKKKVPLLACTLYMYSVQVCGCRLASLWQRDSRTEGELVCFFSTNVVLAEALWPSVSVSRLWGSGLWGAISDMRPKITSSYLQHIRHQVVIHRCCHCVTFQALNRIYNFEYCAKKKKRKIEYMQGWK